MRIHRENAEEIKELARGIIRAAGDRDSFPVIRATEELLLGLSLILHDERFREGLDSTDYRFEAQKAADEAVREFHMEER